MKEDAAYLEAPEAYDRLAEKYAPLIESHEDNHAGFAVKWCPIAMRFGLYAQVDVPADTFLGLFAGVITNESVDPGKTWRYKAAIEKDGEVMQFMIDGHDAGNWFHFLQLEDEGNVEAFYMPHNNMWQVGFRTIRRISAGEELTLTA